MRTKASVKSAVLELDLYTGKLLSGNMSKIEVSTVNPDDPNAEATDIAGSYHYDLLTNTRRRCSCACQDHYRECRYGFDRSGKPSAMH